MAGQRKLLSEIDRTLKKVSEGIDVFNDIWDKVYSATVQSQKEKHESDLKKEIKKLQRFRDQIKNWISNSDVKDKRPLMEARKLIEQKMEEFKVCEKETKTKAYSKEGLAQIERLDPLEEARLKTHTWIQDFLNQLNAQIEAVECDVERLQSGKSRGRNKQEIGDLENTIQRHKWHILKLEQIMRLLDNNALEPDQVDNLKDDIEYYLEANQEPDFLDTYGEDDIYEQLDLDTLGAAAQVALPTEQDMRLDEPSTTAELVPPTSNVSAPNSVGRTTRSNSGKNSKKSISSSVITGIGRAGAVKPCELKSSSTVSTPVRSNSITASATTPKHERSPDSAPLSRSVSASAEDKSIGRGTPQRSKSSASPVPQIVALTDGAKTPNSGVNAVSTANTLVTPTPKTPPVSSAKDKGANISPSMTNAPPSQGSSEQSPAYHATPTTSSTGSAALPGSGLKVSDAPSSLQSQKSPTQPSASLHPLTEEQSQVLRLIDMSFQYLPDACDSEKANPYVPRSLYPTPSAFPTTPSPLFENPKIFEKLDVDTLFFIFYYQQGSYQQYLAARELKRRTWGYHKKYKTWFKRHEEPQVTGEDYEQGTFVYFDYETGWCQRIKTDFTFEYSYLEDELV